ncbi:MAG: FecR domain-containing protein [Cyclobacteriaceae bacterium]|nr:FecR domain-containing protein [Cyclobacteriaceae bacterium]
MNHNETKYWELFIRRQANEIGAEDLAALNSWKKTNPEAYLLMEEVYRQTDHADENAFSAESDWHDLKAIIASESDHQPPIVKIFPWVARVAAAILVVLGFTYIFYQQIQTDPQNRVMQTLISTDNSSIKQVVLPDSSVIWLNKGSEILYPEEFSSEARIVYLKGEAFFDVAPNKDWPFIIQAGNSKTTVIGTSFNLRAYGGEDEIRLTVVTGKVAFTLSDDREKVIVTPGNRASLNNSDLTIMTQSNTDINFLSWKTRQLIFNNQPLDELIASLQRHYGTKIRLGNSGMSECRFTGNFTDTSLDDVLNIITRSLEAAIRSATELSPFREQVVNRL